MTAQLNLIREFFFLFRFEEIRDSRRVTTVTSVTPVTETDRIKRAYDFIKKKHREVGPFDIKLVEDKDALKVSC